MTASAAPRCPRCFHLVEAGECTACGWADPFPEEQTIPPPGAEADVDVLPDDVDLDVLPAATDADALPEAAGLDSLPDAGDFDVLQDEGPLPSEPGELPPEPSGGFSPETGAPPPSDAGRHPRRLIWLLLLGSIVLYGMLLPSPAGGGFSVESFFQTVPTEPTLRSAGALEKGLFDDVGLEWWRLFLATFVHARIWVLLVSGFMVWTLMGRVERLGGSGLVLFMLTVVGGALNVIRVGVEPASSLHAMSGLWPVGLACGAAALALNTRLPRSDIRNSSISLSLAFEGGLLAIYAYYDMLFSWSLVLVMGCSLAAGAFVGAVWPVDRRQGPSGCLVSLIALVVLGSAWLGRDHGLRHTTPPPPELRRMDPGLWEDWKAEHPGVRTTESLELRPVTLDELQTGLEVPKSWEPMPTSLTRKCPKCEREVELPQPQPEDPEATVDCPGCGAKVKARKKQTRAVFTSGVFGSERLIVWAYPRHPFDAADTLAYRLLGEFQLPTSWFQDAVVFEENTFKADAMDDGYAVSARGMVNGRPSIMRLYVFTTQDRTVFLVFMRNDSGDPLDWEQGKLLYDASARTTRVLEK